MTFTQDEAYLLLRALDYCLNPERDMLDLREPHPEAMWKAVQAKVLAMSKGTASKPDLDAGQSGSRIASAMPASITATRIHDVYQEEFYRKDKTGKALAHPTHADLIKAVIHRLLGVEITEPWRGEPVGEGADRKGDV